MFISTAPLRVSLVGGGTDLPGVYTELGGGGWYSLAINKYAYAISHSIPGYCSFNMKQCYTDTLVLHKTLCAKYDALTGICCGVDLPTSPSGLGASSALAICITEVFLHSIGEELQDNILRVAYETENAISGCGVQDHSAAFNCGFRRYTVDHLGAVTCGDIIEWDELTGSMFLLYTGRTGEHCNKTLPVISKSIHNHRKTLELLNEFDVAVTHRNYSMVTSIIDEAWEVKKKTSIDVSNCTIDNMISDLRKLGASGIKLCGSGGGGYILGFHEDREWLKSNTSVGDFLDFRLANSRVSLRELGE